MKKTTTITRIALTLVGVACAGAALAQVAGATTTVGVSVVESTQVAMGWSVKKTLLGKTVYNDVGKKVGKVEDLIVSPDKNVSYVIVGAGGFVGIGRHDVAVPVTQIQDRGGRLIMAGATPESLKALPVFAYADDRTQRTRFMEAAERDIAQGKVKVSAMEKSAGTMEAQAKVKMDQDIVAMQANVKAAEARLGEMKQAEAGRWKEFQAGVNEATAKLRRVS